jgi:hypothetical protein
MIGLPEELTHMTGRTADGRIETVRIVPEGKPVTLRRRLVT